MLNPKNCTLSVQCQHRSRIFYILEFNINYFLTLIGTTFRFVIWNTGRPHLAYAMFACSPNLVADHIRLERIQQMVVCRWGKTSIQSFSKLLKLIPVFNDSHLKGQYSLRVTSRNEKRQVWIHIKYTC